MSEQLRTRVVTAIRSLADGQGASVQAVALQADLMALESVVGAVGRGATTPDLDVLAGSVVLLLEEAANSLEEQPLAGTTPNRAAAARAALGLEPGTQGRPLRGRRNLPSRVGIIAGLLGYEPASLFRLRHDGRSAFDTLIDDVADFVVRREVAYLVAERRLAQQARRPPLESAMRVDWLSRFERYYAIWSYIAGIRYDVELALAASQHGEADELRFYAVKSLWYYARFVAELEAFNVERGGLWVTPDPAAEQRIADAVWLLREPTPLSELDDSVLRLVVAANSEFAVFFAIASDDPTLGSLAARWGTWIASCGCVDLESPDEDCRVHRSLAWTRTFMEDLDRQWDLLADWYDVPRPASQVDPTRTPRWSKTT
jgi:hypothetical protein